MAESGRPPTPHPFLFTAYTMKHFEDTESLITVRDWLRFAVSRFNEAELFFGHGTDNAFDEAAYLILHTLHLPLDRLEPFLDASLTHGESEQVQAVIERRVRERLPAAYLTHEAWLGAHRVYVDERVIVPRSFIAELLHEQLAPWVDNPDEVTRALDLCTGSGCLAVLAALANPNTEDKAVDLSSETHNNATKNDNKNRHADQNKQDETEQKATQDGRTYD